ncbi:MAG TPA: VacB/RNase II family 3'-5' exoribonuclease [Methylomirabilota bacterium]|nr:VacB/RNase II family 3'-5' exoribonuclease [Methylomirabilota bacterium]
MRWKGAHAPEDGDWIIAEIPWHGPAHLVEVLGADDRPAWDDAAVASQYRLRVTFPSPALAEAAAWHEPTARELKGREDHRDDTVVTIDPKDARDHDDALGVRALGGGHHEVGVHIADVSWYVRPGSALDAEARARGTSCYLPGGVVPMLPERLSGDLCSLREGADRLALSVFATLDESGRLHGYRFAATVIRSRAKLSYEQVQAELDGDEPLAPALQEPLATLMKLARQLRARRLAVGALQLESVEVKAVVDEKGETLRLERRPHLESHELVEEFMLLANRCVGEAAALRGSGVLWRVHEPPPGRKLADLDETLRVLGLPRLPRHVEDAHRALQALLEVPLDPPKRRLVHRMVLRSLARARYLERDLGHFGLSTREYLHFTSPIRRYPDLHNHRRVREWIGRARDEAWDPHETAALAAECSGREQDATDAEREATKVKGLRLLAGRLGERVSGTISGLVPRGCFVELDDPPVDGFMAVGDQLDDRFELDAAGVRLVGQRTRRRFTLGDTVQVTIARVDVPARECDLALEQDDTRRGRHGKPARRSARRQGWH